MPEKPDWHTEESWRVELLDWRNKPEEFDLLCKYAIGKVSDELRNRGKDLAGIVSDDELRKQVRIAAETYEDQHKRLIGLATHVHLRIWAFVGCRLRGEPWD
jgi:hypothetical protein